MQIFAYVQVVQGLGKYIEIFSWEHDWERWALCYHNTVTASYMINLYVEMLDAIAACMQVSGWCMLIVSGCCKRMVAVL